MALAVLLLVLADVPLVINQFARPHVSVTAEPALAMLARLPVLAARTRAGDYQRDRFGAAWTDDNDAMGGRNGCDTRNDILTRDIRDARTTATSSCPVAVASGELRSPYTGQLVVFQRGPGTGAKVQIDHIVPLAYAWDMGARGWPQRLRVQFANDPANLVAVDGTANQIKSDSPPARWMPSFGAFHCQYAMSFVLVMDTYGLLIDRPSVPVLRRALASCASR